MCHDSCLDYARDAVRDHEVRAKRVLEVGSCDVNGSVRSILQRRGPSRYVGVDVQDGPGVDLVCDVSGLVPTFGESSFDLVVSTEMLEHVEDWRGAILNLKRVTAPGGTLLLTTRSPGFGFHGYPADYWRFTVEDMKTIFADMVEVDVQSDPEMPGVFVRAVKPEPFQPADLSGMRILSVVRRVRTDRVTGLDRSLSVAVATIRKVIPVRVMNLVRYCNRQVRQLAHS